MITNLINLKKLAEAAQQNQCDPTGFNDYSMALEPTTVLELIEEIECHRLVNAEGFKPDSNILLSGVPYAGSALGDSLDNVQRSSQQQEGHA